MGNHIRFGIVITKHNKIHDRNILDTKRKHFQKIYKKNLNVDDIRIYKGHSYTIINITKLTEYTIEYDFIENNNDSIIYNIRITQLRGRCI